jgi:arylsulfatase A-like enzyme
MPWTRLLLAASLLLLAAGCDRQSEVRSVVRLFEDAPHGGLGLESEARDCALVGAGESLRQSFEVPPKARLDLSYGVHKSYWRWLARPVRVEVEATPRGEGARLLHEGELPSRRNGRANGWQRLEVDLADMAGQELDLEIRITPVGDGRVLTGRRAGKPIRVCIGSPMVLSDEQTARKPIRVLLLGIDTLRADQLGAYGAEPSLTPFIDELASRGTLFENAFSQANWTLPGFASIFTGLYAGHHRAETTRRLPEGVPTLPGVLRSNGFVTVGFHDGGYMRSHFGWADSFDVYSRSDGVNSVDRIADWILDHEATPSLVFFHTYDVHAPYGDAAEHYREGVVPAGYSDVKGLANMRPGQRDRNELLDEADLGYLVGLYRSEIRWLDDGLRMLFDRLGGWRLLDDTLVVLLSDHGEEFGERGGLGHGGRNLHRELVKTPLIVAGPGVAAGRRIEPAVENIDLLPTLVEWLELEGFDPEGVDGSSFARVLTDSSEGYREALRGPAISQNRSTFAVRAGRWELQGDAAERNLLIDIELDPAARSNVAAEHPEIVDRLRSIAESRVSLHYDSTEEKPLDLGDDPELARELRALGYID